MKTAQSQDQLGCFDLQARLGVLWRPADRKSLLAKLEARVSIDTSINHVFSFKLCYNHYPSVSARLPASFCSCPCPQQADYKTHVDIFDEKTERIETKCRQKRDGHALLPEWIMQATCALRISNSMHIKKR